MKAVGFGKSKTACTSPNHILVCFVTMAVKHWNPFPVTTNISDSSFANFFSRMTKLGPELKCNPGSPDGFINQAGDISKTYRKGDKRHVMSSYYTGGLLPGGYCNDQESVKGAINWKYEDDDKVYPIPLGN